MTQDERNTLIFRIAGLALVFMGLAPLVRQACWLGPLAVDFVRSGGSARDIAASFVSTLGAGMYGVFGLAMLVTSRPMSRLLLGRQRHRLPSWHEDALGIGFVLTGCYMLASAAWGATLALAVAEVKGVLLPQAYSLSAAGLALVAAGRSVARLLPWQAARSRGPCFTTAEALSAGLSILGVVHGTRYGAAAVVACWGRAPETFLASVPAPAAIGLLVAAAAVLGAGRLGRALARSATDLTDVAQKLAPMPAQGWVAVTLHAGLLYLLLQALMTPWGSAAAGWFSPGPGLWLAAYAGLAVLAVLLALVARLLVPAVVPVIWRGPSPGGRDQRDASVLALETAMTVLLLACIARLLVDVPVTWPAAGAVYPRAGALVIALVLLGFRGDLAAALAGRDAGRDRREAREERRALLHVCVVLLGVAFTLRETVHVIGWVVPAPATAGIVWLYPAPAGRPVRLLAQAALGPVLVLAARPLSRLLAHGPLLPLIPADRRPRS